MNKIKIPSYY